VALDWTEEEQRALEAGKQRYPADRFDAVQRYVKVAAMLPRKSVRDVALRVRWTVNQHMLKKRKPGELLPAGVGAAVGKKPLAHGGLLPPKAPTLPPVPMVRMCTCSMHAPWHDVPCPAVYMPSNLCTSHHTSSVPNIADARHACDASDGGCASRQPHQRGHCGSHRAPAGGQLYNTERGVLL
jgi:hypothetical protein